MVKHIVSPDPGLKHLDPVVLTLVKYGTQTLSCNLCKNVISAHETFHKQNQLVVL